MGWGGGHASETDRRALMIPHGFVFGADAVPCFWWYHNDKSKQIMLFLHQVLNDYLAANRSGVFASFSLRENACCIARVACAFLRVQTPHPHPAGALHSLPSLKEQHLGESGCGRLLRWTF